MTPNDFRLAMSRLAGGVVVLSTLAGEHDHAMTANAITSVSLDPPLILACVEVEARFHDAIIESGVWGISLLGMSQRGVAEWLSTPGRPLIGQLDQVPHHRGKLGTALLDQSLATVECTTYALYPAGDHSIVVGEVQSVTVADEPEEALVYYRSRYGGVA